MNVLGLQAENLASKYIQAKKFEIVLRNFQSRYGEIDIIALKNKDIVCIEVKASMSDVYDSPGLRVNKIKILKIQKCFEVFVSRFPEYEGYTCRVDVVAVSMRRNTFQDVQHFENVQLYDV